MNFSFKTIDEPNADLVPGKGTGGRSINNNGAIAGFYHTSTDQLGFIESAGVFTTLFGPAGSHNIAAAGINDSGQVAGEYTSAGGHNFGFFYDGATYTTINDPNANNFFTVANGINDSGQIVGDYNSGGGTHGFLYSGGTNGTYATIDVPGAKDTFAQGINAAGAIVGFFTDNSNKDHGFLDNNGAFTTLNDLLATGANGTRANGINDQGQIVGTYQDGSGNHGFLYSGGIYTTLDDPNATPNTSAFGINDSGRIVGNFSDSTTTHGFATLPTKNDFNGDGSSDILWRSTNGALVDWLMNGSTVTSSGNPASPGNPTPPDASWSVAGIADFNGDGQADVLWRNTGGTLVDWTMNGSTVTSSAYVTLNGAVPDASWSVAGVGDLNGDGMSDIVWRKTDGTLVGWLMNGSTVTSSGTLTSGGSMVALDASWTVAGVGDFSGDGKADLLWRNTSGEITEWQMNGTAVAASADVTSSGAALRLDASWSVAGVGDFNGDGNADVLWRQASTGSLEMWLMNGSTVTSIAPVTYQGVSPDASWSVVEIGDFNGDGNSDILWRNTGGTLNEWLMNGNTVTQALAPTVNGALPDSTWNVQAKPANFS